MRVAVLSDVHGNVVALDAVLADVGDVDGLWFLGDLVAHGPRPVECVRRVRALPGLVAVRGNTDAIATRRPGVEAPLVESRRQRRWRETPTDEVCDRARQGSPGSTSASGTSERRVTIWNGRRVSRSPSQEPLSIGRSSRSTSVTEVCSNDAVTRHRGAGAERLVQPHHDVARTVRGELDRLDVRRPLDADQRLDGRRRDGGAGGG